MFLTPRAEALHYAHFIDVKTLTQGGGRERGKEKKEVGERRKYEDGREGEKGNQAHIYTTQVMAKNPTTYSEEYIMCVCVSEGWGIR